jgi:hypothetical protein
MTVLEVAHHSIIIIEHDPMLYEDTAEMVEYVFRALSDAAKELAVLLYAPGADPFQEDRPGILIVYDISTKGQEHRPGL